ncbi:MAG: carboxylesterase/lipase family protein [Acidimicrobiia bacterium]
MHATDRADDLIAATTGGKVRGVTRDGIGIFRSIPYAAPPVGDRRFKPPAAVEPWDGVRDALRFGPVAPQLPSPLETMFGAADPECDEAASLTLSVYTPGLDDAKRPVMFWIHGGAFVNGTGGSPIYDGRRFARHGDVVVVSINYRLGAFGFLHLDDIFGQEFAGSGNAGILDQVCALQWVRDNIVDFGGDPDRITIFGESAGGMSVGTLLGLPVAQGMYSGAISQSGGASFCVRADQATATARTVLTACGIETVEQLRDAPMESILDAQRAIFAAGLRTDLPFVPVVEGNVLPQRPIDAVRDGLGAVPTIIGTNRDEMTMFTALDLGTGTVNEATITAALTATFGDRAAAVASEYHDIYPDALPADIATALATDRVFRTPALRLAEAGVSTRPTWMYLFTWESPVMDGALKSCHALELPFMWDALDRPGLSMLTGDAPDRQPLADEMHAAWIRFARTGDPGWPTYDLTRRATQRFDTTVEILDDPMTRQRELWSGVG